jgi:hypothetical protein
MAIPLFSDYDPGARVGLGVNLSTHGRETIVSVPFDCRSASSGVKAGRDLSSALQRERT